MRDYLGPQHLERVGVPAHQETGVERPIRLSRLVVVHGHLEQVRRRIGSLRQFLHRLGDGRLVEDFAEAQNGNDVAPGEASLADAGGCVHVDPATFVVALVPERLSEGGDGNLPLVAEVLVPEPAGVDLFQLVRCPR